MTNKPVFYIFALILLVSTASAYSWRPTLTSFLDFNGISLQNISSITALDTYIRFYNGSGGYIEIGKDGSAVILHGTPAATNLQISSILFTNNIYTDGSDLIFNTDGANIRMLYGSFQSDDLAGSGNAYACLNSVGAIYRSATPCI